MHESEEGYLDRTDHIFILGEEPSDPAPNDNRTNPSSNESLDRLLGRKTNKGRPSPNHAANIGKDIVCDDETNRKKEPNESLENGVDNKVGLENDKEEGHVRPAELGELICIRPRCQRHHEKHKSYTPK
jgi:hypothetical protein